MPIVTPKRELFTPAPADLWAAVCVDVYWSWDKETKYKDQDVEVTSVKDFIHLAWELDPAAGTTTVDEVERRWWVTQRYTVIGKRIGRDGKQVMNKDYTTAVLRSRDNILPVAMSPTGEPEVFSGPKSTFYKTLLAWGGENFIKAYAAGTVTFERLIGTQWRLLVTHSLPDKNGQVWPRVEKVQPPKEGQNIQPSGLYVRVKDREENEPAIPF